MRPALNTDNLLGAVLAGRAARPESAPRREGDAGFAGLLDGARQQQGGAYDGSAFDVREARPQTPAPRNDGAARTERRPIDAARPPARQEPRRDADAPEAAGDAAPRASEARPATSAGKPRGSDAPREPSRASKEAAAAAETEPPGPPAGVESEAAAVVSLPAGAEPPAAAAPTTQEWMARWATLTGTAPQAGSAEGEAALPTVALQRPADAKGAASAGEGPTAQAAGTMTGLPDAAAQAAGAAAGVPAGFDEARAEAALPPAVAAAARLDAPAGLPGAQATAPATPGAAASGSAPPAGATVPVPMDAPDFSQALGWQLATLARDGVHEAQLQLNPVEMGPVQVQILLDRGQAQIDFTAAQARTREVLEAGWPALAAAMHSAGFTLGGGGVFEQRSPERDGQGGSGGERSRREGEGGEAPAQPGVGRVAGAAPRGLLDLYA